VEVFGRMTDDRPPRPEPLPFDADGVPEDLREREQWVAWRYTWDTDRDEWTKVPADVATDGYASSTDPDTWTSFAEAVAYHNRDGTDTDGVGFVVSDDDLLVGIDLDDCRGADTGETNAWAEDVVDALPTYWEVSPSGTGLRGFGFGFVPDGGTRADIEDAEGHIEMYETGRYLTVTGHALDDAPADIRQVNDEIADVHAEHIAADEQPKPIGNGGIAATQNDATPRVDAPETGPRDTATDLSDDELLNRAMNAENGDKFRRLWNGDTSSYPSHSEARQALANLLAFWTGGDEKRMLRLFRESDLYRDEDDLRTFENYEIPTALRGRT
jgi:primase-polymerase (primpol)-like protein